jgi:hypothetical protein
MSASQLDEETTRAVNLIERIINRPELGELDRRMAWRSVLTKAVEAFQPGEAQALKAGRLAEEAVRETKENN